MKPKDPKNPSGPVLVGDLKVRVYRDLCIGSGTCHAIASKAYNLDDESKSIIIETADQESENAIIEADKLLDYVLRAKGFKGETMADRMKAAGNQMGNVTAVWAAHKLRNMVAHEVEHDIVADQVKHAVKDLAQAIRTLGVPLQ